MFPTHLLSGRANDLGRTTIGPGNQELLSAVLEWTEPRWSLLARFIGLAGGLALLSYGLWSHRRGDSALPYLGLFLVSSWIIGPWLKPRWTVLSPRVNANGATGLPRAEEWQASTDHPRDTI